MPQVRSGVAMIEWYPYFRARPERAASWLIHRVKSGSSTPLSTGCPPVGERAGGEHGG